MFGYMVRLPRGVHSATAILASMTRKLESGTTAWSSCYEQDELFTVFYIIFSFIVWCHFACWREKPFPTSHQTCLLSYGPGPGTHARWLTHLPTITGSRTSSERGLSGLCKSITYSGNAFKVSAHGPLQINSFIWRWTVLCSLGVQRPPPRCGVHHGSQAGLEVLGPT